MYTLDVTSQHAAYTVAQCAKKGVKCVESKVGAEAEWTDGIVCLSPRVFQQLPAGVFQL